MSTDDYTFAVTIIVVIVGFLLNNNKTPPSPVLPIWQPATISPLTSVDVDDMENFVI